MLFNTTTELFKIASRTGQPMSGHHAHEALGRNFKGRKILMLDELLMMSPSQYSAVSSQTTVGMSLARELRSTCNTTARPFGGMICLFSGDHHNIRPLFRRSPSSSGWQLSCAESNNYQRTPTPSTTTWPTFHMPNPCHERRATALLAD